jgi:hypothetical protein
VNAAFGGAFSGVEPPPNCAVAGLEQIVVPASHTLKMYVAAPEAVLVMLCWPSFGVLTCTRPFR